MKWFSHLTISKKLWLSTGSFFIFLGMIFITSIWVSSRLAADLDLLANKYFVANSLLLDADAGLYRAMSAERTLLFVKVGTPRFNNLKSYHQLNITTASDKFDRVASILYETPLQGQLDDHRMSFEKWQNLLKQVLKFREKNTKTGRNQAVALSLNETSQAFAVMHDIIETNIEQLQRNIDNVVARANNNRENSFVTLGIVALMVLVAGSFLTLISIKAIATPILSLTEMLTQIANGDGDLTLRLDESRRDEMGKMANAFNQFANNQALLIRQIKFSMQHFITTMIEAQNNMGEMILSTKKQYNESDQVALSMEQMSLAIAEVSEIANQTASTINTTDELAKYGGNVVEESIGFIESISLDINDTSKVIVELDSQSQSISSVSDAIREIADQTNLLSLNAAIEAARAGTAGRGFAVVADEVRNLAIRTQQLTQQINASIGGLKNESAHAVVVMKKSLEESQSLNSKALESDKALSDITNSVSQVMGMTIQLASAAEEQSVTAGNVKINAVNLREMAGVSDDLANKTLTDVAILKSLSEQISQQLHRFKVDA